MAVIVSSVGITNVCCVQPWTRSIQQRFVVHKSEVIIPPTLSAKFPYLTRNKSAPLVVKTSQKPQIVTETHENTEINVVIPKPNEEEKPETGDSEDETLDEVNVPEKEAYSNISNGYVELSSDENILNTDAEQRAAMVSNSSSGNLNKQLRIWDEWKDWYRQSQKDIRTWGIGKAPIFLVYDNGEGEVRVFINEKEIHDRFGSLPFLGEEARVLLGEKLAQANQVAMDIERGVFKPPRHSSVFEFASYDKSHLEKRGLVGSYVFSGVSSIIVTAPSVLKVSVVGFYVLSSSLFLWVAWRFIFRSGPEEETRGDDNNFALDLESKRGVEKEGEVGRRELAMKPSLMGDILFEKIALQFQHLARQVGSFLALILQNIRVWIKEAQSGMKQLVMGIDRHEFKKRIAKIQDVIRQALSSFAMGLHNERVTTKKQLSMKPTSTVGIQDVAKQSNLMEENVYQVFSQQDNRDDSNSKTMGGNVDGRRRDLDQPSNSNTT